MERRYDVKISIQSRAGDESFEQTVDGTAYRKPNGWYLRYEEKDEGGNATKTLVKLSGEEWKVTRSGAVESEMMFTKGRARDGYYRTAGIELRVTTIMRVSSLGLEEGKGVAQLEYDLQIGDAPTQRHCITYRIF